MRSNDFPIGITPGRLNVGYTDKSVTKNTRIVADSWWRDLINRFGISVFYYPIDINTTGRHKIYEEVFSFQEPKALRVMLDLPREAWLFSKFGLHTDADFTAVVHIGTWVNTFGSTIDDEPKVGDIIRIDNTGWEEEEMDIHTQTGYASGDTICSILNDNIPTTCQIALSANIEAFKLTYGTDSPELSAGNGESYIGNLTTLSVPFSSSMGWRRWPQLYQITEKRYHDPELNTDFLGGHYVWVLRGKRFEYSYEPNAPRENPNAPNNTPGGIVDDRDLIEEISDEIFDYEEYPDSDTNPYGKY